MTHLGYMRRLPGPPISPPEHTAATRALARCIFGADRVIIAEAHGIVGLLFPNMLEVFAPEEKEEKRDAEVLPR